MKTICFQCAFCGNENEVEMSGARRPKHPDRPIKVSQRELQVFRALAGGETYEEIAARLRISRRTVEDTVARVVGRLHAESRDQALAMLIEAKLL